MNKILELTRKIIKPVVGFVGLLILMSSTMILGQEESAEESSGILEEIVVTASRRGGTDITITPVSMTAITGTDIERYSSRDLRDIALMVPNLSAATVSAFNSASFAMRGVAETTIILYKEAPVGVVIDDFFIPHLQTQNLVRCCCCQWPPRCLVRQTGPASMCRFFRNPQARYRISILAMFYTKIVGWE